MASISQTDAYTNTASQTTYTTGSLSIGTGNGGRTIFALILGRGGAASISSVTIGSQTATLVAANGGGLNVVAAIYKLQASSLGDPTATTAAVSVTFNAAVTRGVGIIVAVTSDSINQTAHATANDQDVVQDTNSETATVSINIPANGFALGIGGGYCETDNGAWTGLTGGTKYQVSPTAAETRVQPAYGSNLSASTPLSITYSNSTANIGDIGGTTGVTASFAPSGYTFVADVTTFALTGEAATNAYRQAAAVTAFALTGEAAANAYKLGAVARSYTLTGQRAESAFPVNAGSIVLAGQAALSAYRLRADVTPFLLSAFPSIDPNSDSGALSTFNIITRIFRMISVSTASFTRPADTTAYNAGDLVANSTTPGAVSPLVFSSAKLGSGRGIIRRIRLFKTAATTTAAIFNIHLFATSPVSSAGDNDAFAVDTSANFLGTVTIDMTSGAFATAADIIKTAAVSPEINFDLASVSPSSRRLYALIQTGTGGTYTPESEETFTVTIEMAASD